MRDKPSQGLQLPRANRWLIKRCFATQKHPWCGPIALCLAHWMAGRKERAVGLLRFVWRRPSRRAIWISRTTNVLRFHLRLSRYFISQNCWPRSQALAPLSYPRFDSQQDTIRLFGSEIRSEGSDPAWRSELSSPRITAQRHLVRSQGSESRSEGDSALRPSFSFPRITSRRYTENLSCSQNRSKGGNPASRATWSYRRITSQRQTARLAGSQNRFGGGEPTSPLARWTFVFLRRVQLERQPAQWLRTKVVPVASGLPTPHVLLGWVAKRSSTVSYDQPLGLDRKQRRILTRSLQPSGRVQSPSSPGASAHRNLSEGRWVRSSYAGGEDRQHLVRRDRRPKQALGLMPNTGSRLNPARSLRRGCGAIARTSARRTGKAGDRRLAASEKAEFAAFASFLAHSFGVGTAHCCGAEHGRFRPWASIPRAVGRCSPIISARHDARCAGASKDYCRGRSNGLGTEPDSERERKPGEND